MSTTSPPPDGPEYLEQGGGEPVPSSDRGGGSGRRTALVAGGAVAVLALAGAGTWAAMSFLGGGSQPAEALPAGTLGYASVDLDPSGSQKIEAVRMLNKFPAFKKEFGLDATDDLRRRAFEEAYSDCDGVSYAEDVEPWLGNAFAVAAVEAGEEQPSAVAVFEVTDAAAAEDGFETLKNGCDDSEELGWVIEGDWAIAAESEDIAQQVVDATSDGTLADDSDYQEWMDTAGDPGVVSMYASPDAGPVIADLVAGEFATGGASASSTATGSGSVEEAVALPEPEVPEEMLKSFEDFPGAAATVRFTDGALELEVVGGAAGPQVFASGEESVDAVTTLPEDTAVAFGVLFADGWGQKLLDQAAKGSGMSPEDLVAQGEQLSGLSLPEDLEALLGDSMAIALGGDFTLENAMNSSDGSDVPVGVKVRGEASEIERVLGQLTQLAGPGFEQVVGSDSEGDTVAVGPNPDYRSELLAEGGLGESEAFQAVVPEADSSPVVLFVNFDAGDWLTSVAAGDQEAIDNLEPLEAFGFSIWQDDDTSHALVKLTTN